MNNEEFHAPPIRNVAGVLQAMAYDGWDNGLSEEAKSLEVYTALISWPARGGEFDGEEIDVLAVSEELAREMVKLELDHCYSPGGKIVELTPRTRGSFYM
jgi:hypothetical protein